MDSTTVNELTMFTCEQLKQELKLRFLPISGTKPELIARLITDNEKKLQLGTIEMVKEERERRKSHQVEVEELEKKVKELSLQLEQQNPIPGTSQAQPPTQTENISTILTEISKQQQTFLKFQCEMMKNSNNNEALQDILSEIVQTQNKLAESSSPSFQVFSTSDTSNAIPLFGGNKVDNAVTWIREVERVASLANWTGNLTLVNASMRLRGPASDWHKAIGKNYDSWHEYKNKLTERFSLKMSFAEFITYQNKRTLKATETITEYIYFKNAMFEKSPTKIPDTDKVSLILEGITDHRWSIPLATHCCMNVEELLDHASAIDNIRKVQPRDRNYNNNLPEIVSNPKIDKKDNSNYISKFNPYTDKEEEQTCFRCKEKGHISYNCKVPPKENKLNNVNNPLPKLEKLNQQNNNALNRQLNSPPHVNCVQDIEPNITVIPVVLNDKIKLNALPDSGSVITIIDKNQLSPDTQVYPWQKGSYKVAGNYFTPIGWITARVQVGKIDYIMPQIAICENLPVAMILGKDWQLAVYARIIYEPDGKVCIITPTHTEYFPAYNKENKTIACCINLQEIKSVTQEDKKKVMEVVEEYDDIFKNTENDIGKFPDFELEIKLKTEKPISCKPYRLPEPERQFLKQTIETWLEQKICRLSDSPYAAPMFVVQQPLHETTPYRPVVDYSKTINPNTVLDSQPIERMEDIVTTIAQFAYKFKLDIYHAYHNICIKESDIFKTAVITQDYHVEFMRVMFGLVGGPSIMSKVIKTTYGSLYSEGVRAYFDDISGGANNIEDHIKILRKVFDKTREKNLKLNKEKCNFIDTEIPLFGKIVGYKQERTDPKRTAAVEQYRTLSTLTEVRSFLGFTNTFRKYIKDYALKAKPLQELLKKNKSQTDSFEENNKKKKVTLLEDQQKAFEELKKLVTTAPVLANFEQDAETIVETDSSYQGMGACLLQIQNGEKKVIEYASRCLKDTETRYHINELEVTAVHWAIISKFRIYLLGTKFTLITDSYSTAYIINKAKMNRKFARYVIDLAPFEFVPVHRPGKQNVIADHLSRYPLNDLCMMVISSNTEKLKLAQSKDEFIQQICQKLSKEAKTQHLKQIHESFKIENGILLHNNNEQLHHKEKIVVPQSLRSTVIKMAHDDSGHLDFTTTLNRLKSKYWWKSIRKDVKSYTSACQICAKTNRRTTLTYGEMCRRPVPETPMQVISSDHIVALPMTESGNTYIFVHIDHATRYIFAKPAFSLTAQTVIDTIENDIIYTYGPPFIYITDSAPCFMSQSTQKFFAKYGIEHLPTTPYTPNSNGLVERANATIVSTLTKFAFENKEDWDKLLPKVVLAINTSKQKTTGYSPFYLLHGYEPRMPPMEIHIGTVVEDIERNHQLQYLQEARQIALENIEVTHTQNKKRFDLGRIQDNFQKGDFVLYEWSKTTDTKLTPRYKGPFKILRKIGSVCYEIQDVQKPSTKKIVHVQFLKLLSQPHNLDFISDISATQTVHNPDDDNPNDDSPDEDNPDNYHPDEDNPVNNHPDEDNPDEECLEEDSRRQKTFISSRGRITKKPFSYKI